MTLFNEYSALRHVVLRAPDAVGPDASVSHWRELNFTAPPDTARARQQYLVLREIIQATGCVVHECPPDHGLTLDAVYVRDASIVTPRGVVLCRMGKHTRAQEPRAQARVFESLGVPVLGAIEAPGQIEGGDIIWFDERIVAVGRGYRTNDEGIRQFREFVGAETQVIVVPLPHYRGPGDVFHLMSIVSPVDRDLAVVYSPLMPVPFREWLLGRGMTCVEVPDTEFESMGANVLATAPRRCLMLDGNPQTRARLEAAGASVITYEGTEISMKGGGGPTCLTRPLARLP